MHKVASAFVLVDNDAVFVKARGAVLRFRPNDCKFVALLLAVRLAIFERSHTIVLFEQILEV